MASIKLKFRPSVIEGIAGSLYYQIIHNRTVRRIFTEYRIFPEEWNNARSVVTIIRNSDREATVRSIRENIRCDIVRLNRIVSQLTKDEFDFTTDDIVEEYKRYLAEYSIFRYMESCISCMRRRSDTRTINNYVTALNSFRRFRCGEDLMLDLLSSELLKDYEAYLRKRGNSPNTISFYMRTLRAVYNSAVDKGVITDENPFRHVYTGIEKTMKRAVSIQVVKKIRNLDLVPTKRSCFARDMFMLSFYLRGMSLIDMAFLKKSDLANGYITYRRHKTGQRMRIEWTGEMQEIVDRYKTNPTEYLLPIIMNDNVDGRKEYLRVGNIINYHLRKISGILNLDIPLTLYCARHSWASAAKSLGVPLSVISEGMGHYSETTTLIYLATIETSVVDQANAKILRCI